MIMVKMARWFVQFILCMNQMIPSPLSAGRKQAGPKLSKEVWILLRFELIAQLIFVQTCMFHPFDISSQQLYILRIFTEIQTLFPPLQIKKKRKYLYQFDKWPYDKKKKSTFTLLCIHKLVPKILYYTLHYLYDKN